MTALELTRRGRKVLLLDGRAFPRWKVCGATLSPGTKALLADAGLGGLLGSLAAKDLHTLRLGGWSSRADLPLNGSVAVSRSALDRGLVQEACRRGVHFCSEARASLGPTLADARIVEVRAGGERREIVARCVVAADGLGSGLMAQAGVPCEVPRSSRRRLVGIGGRIPGCSGGYEDGVIHMAVGESGYVGLVRVEDGSLNLAAALDPRVLREAGSPAEVIATLLSEGGWQLPSDPPFEGWKGTPELTRNPLRPGSERLFAVGDAAGYVEPFTGEGVFWALTGARLLAPFVAGVDKTWNPHLLEGWARAHGRSVGRAQRLCRITSWALARPGLSRTLIRALQNHPGLARPLVRRVGAPILTST
jgi:flavin-dependent dehydrogenase